MNLCLRPKAVEVVVAANGTSGAPSPPALPPQDLAHRGQAADLHCKFSHMHEPILVPRDQLVINLDFDDIMFEGSKTQEMRLYGGTARQIPAFPSAAVSGSQLGALPPLGQTMSFGPFGSPGAVAQVTIVADAKRARDTTVRNADGSSGVGNRIGGGGAAAAGGGYSGDGAVSSGGVAGCPRVSWVEGQEPPGRGFVRVKSERVPEGTHI